MLTTLDVNYLGEPGVIAAVLLEGRDGSLGLVDPGPATSLPGLRAALAACGRELRDVGDIFLTHIHLDHAGATGTIVREHPRVRVHVHERGAPHMIDPSRLMKSAGRLYGDDMDRLWGEMVPVPEASVRALSGGETIHAAGRTLRVAATPGHASHHVSYFDPETGTAFVGDTAGIRMAPWRLVLPPTPPPDIDIEAWDASLNAILAWRPDALFVTHFGLFADPDTHVAVFKRWLGELTTLATAVLVDDALHDEERMKAFAIRLATRIGECEHPEAAGAYARAIPFEHCWLGLARYLAR